MFDLFHGFLQTSCTPRSHPVTADLCLCLPPPRERPTGMCRTVAVVSLGMQALRGTAYGYVPGVGNGEGVSNWRFAASGVALVAVLSIFSSPPAAVGAQEGRTLKISVGGGQTVVSATGCNWPEGEQYGPGSSVGITVITWFAGGGRTSGPTTIGRSDVVPSSGGSWEYPVPRAPVAEVPAWATEVVVGAEARCHQAIGNGFDYDPASFRRALVRPPASSTTAVTDPPASTSQATAAEPIAGTATFTG